MNRENPYASPAVAVTAQRSPRRWSSRSVVWIRVVIGSAMLAGIYLQLDRIQSEIADRIPVEGGFPFFACKQVGAMTLAAVLAYVVVRLASGHWGAALIASFLVCTFVSQLFASDQIVYHRVYFDYGNEVLLCGLLFPLAAFITFGWLDRGARSSKTSARHASVDDKGAIGCCVLVVGTVTGGFVGLLLRNLARPGPLQLPELLEISDPAGIVSLVLGCLFGAWVGTRLSLAVAGTAVQSLVERELLAKPNTIAILDDEPDRLDAMIPILHERFPQLNVVTFDNAPDINLWFADQLETCVLICLDHDLGPNRQRDGAVFDPGIERDVADYLATHDPVCPIILHTTNTDARPGMIMALEDAGWTVSYVSPYDDVLWIREVWANAVGDALATD